MLRAAVVVAADTAAPPGVGGEGHEVLLRRGERLDLAKLIQCVGGRVVGDGECSRAVRRLVAGCRGAFVRGVRPRHMPRGWREDRDEVTGRVDDRGVACMHGGCADW